MTAEIRRYVLVSEQDIEGTLEYSTLEAAIVDAKIMGHAAVVAHIYTWEDSELIWTPDEEDVWPPSVREG